MTAIKGHPKLSAWPPSWSGAYRGADQLAIGEQGTLRGVKLFKKTKKVSAYLSIEIEFKGNRFNGILHSDEENLLQSALEKLKSAIGKPVAGIGQLEI